MADFKEINAEKFKENLISNFGDNDKVNILFDELVQKNTAKNPFFYSAILNYIQKNHLSIFELVDSKSKVNFDKINVAMVQAKKEFEKLKEQEEIENEKNNNENFDKENLEEIKDKFNQINFDNLTSQNLNYILDQYDDFFDSVSPEDFTKVINHGQHILSSDDKVIKLFQIMKKIDHNGYENLTDSEKSFLGEISEEDALNIGLNLQDKSIDRDKLKDITKGYVHITAKIQELVEDKGFVSESDLDNILSQHSELISMFPGISKKSLVLEKSDNGELKEYVENLMITANKLSIDEEEVIVKTQFNESVDERKEPSEEKVSLDNIEALLDDMFAEMEDPAYSQEEIEIKEDPISIEEEITEQENETLEIDIEEKVQEVNLEEQVDPMTEEMEQELDEQAQDETELEEQNLDEAENEQLKEELEEEEYEAPTFDEEKTGLAGLVAAIANSRVGRAVKNLFKAKDTQKRLNAPVTQRTEDGVKITEYESNGSLMPATIQARNFFRDFAVNTVEAVTNFTKNISNAIRGNQDEVVNRPTIIKSDSVQEQENNKQQITEKAQEKTEIYKDNNPWAVSKQALEAQAKINAENKYVSHHVITSPDNSDKSGPSLED